LGGRGGELEVGLAERGEVGGGGKGRMWGEGGGSGGGGEWGG